MAIMDAAFRLTALIPTHLRSAGQSQRHRRYVFTFSFQSFFPGSLHTDIIKDWAQLDMFYTYRDFEYWGGTFNFSVERAT